MYFQNVLPATTNFSQSISHFASLLRNLRLWAWGAKMLNSLSQEARQWRPGLWSFSGDTGPHLAAQAHPLLPTQAGSFWGVPDCPCLNHFMSFPWKRQETADCVFPASTSECSLDFKSPLSCRKREPGHWMIKTPNVPLHSISEAGLGISLGRGLRQAWFGFVKWLFHQPHGCSC